MSGCTLHHVRFCVTLSFRTDYEVAFNGILLLYLYHQKWLLDLGGEPEVGENPPVEWAAPSAEPQEEATNEEERESSKKVRPLTPKK